MGIQSAAGLLTLVAVLALAAVFLRVRRLARDDRAYAPVQGNAYRVRAIIFWVMIVVGLPLTIWLVRVNPYSLAADAPQVVRATGYQWYWELDRAQVEAGRPVVFEVSSADVNHGFGLYDAQGVLVAQVQAMPGYINRLSHVFKTPGTYRVLCLEFCGLVHHGMTTEIEVSDGGGSDG